MKITGTKIFSKIKFKLFRSRTPSICVKIQPTVEHCTNLLWPKAHTESDQIYAQWSVDYCSFSFFWKEVQSWQYPQHKNTPVRSVFCARMLQLMNSESRLLKILQLSVPIEQVNYFPHMAAKGHFQESCRDSHIFEQEMQMPVKLLFCQSVCALAKNLMFLSQLFLTYPTMSTNRKEGQDLHLL